MNIFHAQFSTGQVVAATDIPNSTIQTWIKRDLIVGHKGRAFEGGGAPGLHRRFTFFNVMELAVTKALMEVGLTDLGLAFKAAANFAHFGHGPIGDQPQRSPSLPYFLPNKSGATLLCVAGSESCVIHYIAGTDPVPAIQLGLKGHRSQRLPGYVVLEIDSLFDRVVTALGYHPSEVTSLAYSREAVDHAR